MPKLRISIRNSIENDDEARTPESEAPEDINIVSDIQEEFMQNKEYFESQLPNWNTQQHEKSTLIVSPTASKLKSMCLSQHWTTH